MKECVTAKWLTLWQGRGGGKRTSWRGTEQPFVDISLPVTVSACFLISKITFFFAMLGKNNILIKKKMVIFLVEKMDIFLVVYFRTPSFQQSS